MNINTFKKIGFSVLTLAILGAGVSIPFYLSNNNGEEVQNIVQSTQSITPYNRSADLSKSSVDWSGFNSEDRYAPTWEFDILEYDLSNSSNLYAFLNDDSSDTLYLYAPIKQWKNGPIKNIVYDGAGNDSSIYEGNDSSVEWIKYQEDDLYYDNPNVNLTFGSYNYSKRVWEITDPSSIFGNSNDSIFSYTPKTLPTNVNNFIINEKTFDNVNISFSLERKLGNGNIEIFANGVNIYNEINLNDGTYSFNYNWESNKIYDFEIYVDGTINSELSINNILSPSEEISVLSIGTYELKENYIFKNSVDNGILSGNIILLNNDSINISKVDINIVGESINENILASISNDNKHRYIFSKNQLDTGTYDLTYAIEYEDNYGVSKILSSSMKSVTISEKMIDEPKIAISNIHNVILPSTPDWNNGSISVSLEIDNPDSNVEIKNIETELIKNSENQGIESHIVNNDSISIYELNYSDLSSGTYSLNYKIDYEIEGILNHMSGSTNEIQLVENILDGPSLIKHNLSINNYYDSSNKGSIIGGIELENYDSLTDSKVKAILLDRLGNEIDSGIEIILNNGSGSININDLEKGEYSIKIIGNINTDSSNNKVDKTIGMIDNLIIENEEFDIPEFYLSHTEDGEKIMLTFHSDEINDSDLWKDITKIVGNIEIKYIDGEIINKSFESSGIDFANALSYIAFEFENNGNPSGLLEVNAEYTVQGTYEGWEDAGVYNYVNEAPTTTTTNSNSIWIYLLVAIISIETITALLIIILKNRV